MQYLGKTGRLVPAEPTVVLHALEHVGRALTATEDLDEVVAPDALAASGNTDVDAAFLQHGTCELDGAL